MNLIQNYCNNSTKENFNLINNYLKYFFIEIAKFCIRNNKGNINLAYNILENSIKIPLRIVSFNLAFGIQKNEIYKTSERVMVERCKREFPPNGDSDIHNLSACTRNAANQILFDFFNGFPDIIGIQEAYGPSMKALLTYIQNLSSYDNTKYILSGEETCSIIYNELTMGQGESFFVFSKYKGLRCGNAVYFDNSKLLVLNLWFEHNINIKKVIEGLKLTQYSLQPRRIIITTDSNDHYGKYEKIYLHLLNLTLKHPGKPNKTCCEGSNYKFVGDYIFDSDVDRANFYGIPTSVNKNKQLMSDHLPVILDSELINNYNF